MKKILFLLLSVVCWSNSLFAQRLPWRSADEYVADTIKLSDCYYIKDTRISIGEVSLYSAESHPGRPIPTWADGSIVTEEEEYQETVHNAHEVKLQFDEIVETTLTREQLRLIKDHILIVTINASSQTGRVTDIYFTYMEGSATPNTIGQIPLEKFREIELRVKEELVFEPTEAGTARSYLYLYCTYDVEGLSLDDDTLLEQLTPIDGKLSTDFP